jgi:uncharacterized protein (TIGR01777 family)
MRVVIAGGTGFLGQPLTAALTERGHHVTILTRDIRRKESTGKPTAANVDFVRWSPNGHSGEWAASLDGADAIVNLAGESIARRWSAAQKARILESRVLATRSLVAAGTSVRTPPAVFVSGSAVGFYGPLGDEPVTEDHQPGNDFLASVCVAWEAEARAASRFARVACIRTGLVLARDGGALQKMLPPFWFGVGGPVGSGRQFWPWIHRRDWIDLVAWTLESSAVEGPVNATAPNPVTNAVFAKTLGRVIYRPAFMPAPAFAMRLLLGEMADGLLLSGQRAVPAKADRLGFRFSYQQLQDALAEIFR